VIKNLSTSLILVISLALTTVIVAISLKLLLDSLEHIPNLVTSKSLKDYHFDYIIIGGGTAGMMFFEYTRVCLVLDLKTIFKIFTNSWLYSFCSNRFICLRIGFKLQIDEKHELHSFVNRSRRYFQFTFCCSLNEYANARQSRNGLEVKHITSIYLCFKIKNVISVSKPSNKSIHLMD
jgi:hypothetical protein